MFRKYLDVVTESENDIKRYTTKELGKNDSKFLKLINKLDDDDINELQRVKSIYELKSKNLQNIVIYFRPGREKMDPMSAESNFQQLKKDILNHFNKLNLLVRKLEDSTSSDVQKQIANLKNDADLVQELESFIDFNDLEHNASIELRQVIQPIKIEFNFNDSHFETFKEAIKVITNFNK